MAAPAVIIGRKGNVGEVWLETDGSWPTDTTYYAAIPKSFDARFLVHQLRALRLKTLDSSTALPSLRRQDLEAQMLVVPPLDEQRRIVEILESYLSRVDAAVQSLDRARRRAVSLERSVSSGSRIGTLRYLPDVAQIQGGIQKQQKRLPRDNAFPFLRVANVTANGLDLRDVHKIELFGNELEKYRLRAGDLLVVEGNGSPTQIGRACLWDGSIADSVHQNHLIRVRPGAELIPEYLELVWNSPENRETLTAVSSSSSGLHTLSVGKLGRIQIPVPNLQEQRQIVNDADNVRGPASRLDSAVVAAAKRAMILRRSLLAAAFSGRLAAGPVDRLAAA